MYWQIHPHLNFSLPRKFVQALKGSTSVIGLDFNEHEDYSVWRMDFVVNTDGASKGNPGPSSYGYIIKNRDGAIVHQEGKLIGEATNNIAEYTAVIKALEYIQERFSKKAPHKVEVVADSKLVVEQLSGRYKIKSPNLIPLFDQIKRLEIEVGTVFYRSVPRAENFIADRLANLPFERL